jgi:hypothetical protein
LDVRSASGAATTVAFHVPVRERAPELPVL